MSIIIGGYRFEGPYTSIYNLNNTSGVYCVLKRSFSNISSYNIIDVGQSAHILDRISNHNRKICWIQKQYSHYAAYYCPTSQRKSIEAKIRDQYDPPCGEQ